MFVPRVLFLASVMAVFAAAVPAPQGMCPSEFNRDGYLAEFCLSSYAGLIRM